ncbi:MAG TPA: DUF5700 domain-containing putative Zn-dependent protease [Mucilaginibacter sp.]|nr:DUF5700 domain-containing putative Zn-dependent protease [Mucilaginibacter sp.]
MLLAAGKQPLDSLYRYINSDGLLHFAEIKKDANGYKTIIATFKNNHEAILDNIKQVLIPYINQNKIVERKVSIYFATGADGWGAGDITAMDLEYYKDDYRKFISVLKHEIFHTVQYTVARCHKHKGRQAHPLQYSLNHIFLEGTATYISDPAPKTPVQYSDALLKGKTISPN